MATKKEEKIEAFSKTKDFDKQEIINETKTTLTVAYGYSNHYHNVLVKHNISKKTDTTLFVDGNLSFDQFVEKHKVKSKD
ncbi:hypothetical protein [Changchengzhania lutea]|uniref:hypothetical protein n=1 Tax=Changchengzhania lutea TaxID=2049305 RepID=UPI00115CCF68|nr:hypothetical protein [Changchengzhania lutea]